MESQKVVVAPRVLSLSGLGKETDVCRQGFSS